MTLGIIFGDGISGNAIPRLTDTYYLGDATHRWSRVYAPIGRSATLMVAASDAPALVKAQADYICDGVDDNIQIQVAIDAVFAAGGGIVMLSSGTFYMISNFLLTPKSNVWIKGQGVGTTVLQATSGLLTGHLFSVQAALNYFRMSDLSIDMNTVGGRAFDNGYVSSDVLFNDIDVLNSMDVNILCNHTDNQRIHIRHCRMTKGAGHAGSDFVDLVGTDVSANENILINASAVPCSGLTSGGGKRLEFKNNHIIFSAATKAIAISLEPFQIVSGETFPFVSCSIKGNLVYDGTIIVGDGGDKLLASIDTVIDSNILTTPDYAEWDGVIKSRSRNTNLRIKDNHITSGKINPDGNSGVDSNNKLLVGIDIIGNKISSILVNRMLAGSRDVTIKNNTVSKLTNDNSVLYLEAVPRLIVQNNHLYDPNSRGCNIDTSGTGTIINRNTGTGYITENSGTATVVNTATSIAVNHGLAAIPTRVQLTLTNNPTNDPQVCWVDTLGATQFTIHTKVDPGATGAIFDWRAVVGEGN